MRWKKPPVEGVCDSGFPLLLLLSEEGGDNSQRHVKIAELFIKIYPFDSTSSYPKGEEDLRLIGEGFCW
jgi:hypothetical protein